MEHRAGYRRLSGTSSRLDLMASRAGRTISQPGVNVTGRASWHGSRPATPVALVLVSDLEACRALFARSLLEYSTFSFASRHGCSKNCDRDAMRHLSIMMSSGRIKNNCTQFKLTPWWT